MSRGVRVVDILRDGALWWSFSVVLGVWVVLWLDVVRMERGRLERDVTSVGPGS